MTLSELCEHLSVPYNKMRVYRQRYYVIWLMTEVVIRDIAYEEGKAIIMRDLERLFWSDVGTNKFGGIDLAMFGDLEMFDIENLSMIRKIAEDFHAPPAMVAKKRRES